MKSGFHRLATLSLLFALALTLIPVPVNAQTIVSVTPATIVNNVDNTITVTGTGFDNSAAVLLDGSALVTSFLNAQTLTATVPAGTSTGPHAITVSLTSGTVAGPTLNVVTPATPVPPTATSAPAPVARRRRDCRR